VQSQLALDECQKRRKAAVYGLGPATPVGRSTNNHGKRRRRLSLWARRQHMSQRSELAQPPGDGSTFPMGNPGHALQRALAGREYTIVKGWSWPGSVRF